MNVAVEPDNDTAPAILALLLSTIVIFEALIVEDCIASLKVTVMFPETETLVALFAGDVELTVGRVVSEEPPCLLYTSPSPRD